MQDEVDSVEAIISWISSSLSVDPHSSVSPSVPSSVVFVMSSVSIVAISALARVGGLVGTLVGSLVGEEVGSDVSVTFSVSPPVKASSEKPNATVPGELVGALVGYRRSKETK